MSLCCFNLVRGLKIWRIISNKTKILVYAPLSFWEQPKRFREKLKAHDTIHAIFIIKR